jgi:hypothetical protein
MISELTRQALADPPLLPPKVRAQIAEMRTRIHTSLGQVVLAMAALPRYRYLSLVDLQAIVPNLREKEPLIRAPLQHASLVVATQKKDEDAAEPLEIGALDSVAGIAIWASVSTEVDARIRAQVKARVLPVKLKPEDWTSGSKEAGDHAPLIQEGLLDVPSESMGPPLQQASRRNSPRWCWRASPASLKQANSTSTPSPPARSMPTCCANWPGTGPPLEQAPNPHKSYPRVRWLG